MAKNDQPHKYGERGEKKVIVLKEGTKPHATKALTPEEKKGLGATSETTNRKPPQGGSGTAPPSGTTPPSGTAAPSSNPPPTQPKK
jgi:hypothetical protein